jgi:DNA-binding HxlR family transcriptional regulator
VPSEDFGYRFTTDSVARASALLGDRWTFMIIREVFFGVHRFGEMARNLGVSRNLLTERLNRLVDAGVLRREQYRADPDRYEYRLTDAGLQLFPIILTLMRWGDEHLAGDAGPPLLFRHQACGKTTHARVVCSECGDELTALNVDPLPGPGARPGE